MRGRVCAGRPEGHMKASNAMELACGRLEGPGSKVAVNAGQQRLPKVKNRRQVNTFCLKVKPPRGGRPNAFRRCSPHTAETRRQF